MHLSQNTLLHFKNIHHIVRITSEEVPEILFREHLWEIGA